MARLSQKSQIFSFPPRTYIARDPTHVIHQLRTFVPPRTQHISSVSMEHTNLHRSYPHPRVIGYEPPHSNHHVFITIHEPTCSWYNIL